MDKQHLLTIGNLSKQTGVHVKSLRYYEQLGILIPAYTDPDTGYRYYTLSQIPVVGAIRVCIFLDIPLKEFTGFLTDDHIRAYSRLDIPLKEFTGFLTRDQRRIHYKKLLSHGTMLAHRKIRDIREKLRLLEKFRKQMERGEDLMLHGEQAVHALPEKYCWVAPYAGKQQTPAFNILMTRIFDDIDRRRLRLGTEAGLLSFHRKAGTEQFLYAEVEVTGREARQMKEIMRLPAASFLCAIRQESGIAEAPRVFPDLFAQEYDKIVMETELFSGDDYDVALPKFELRCSLPPGGK